MENTRINGCEVGSVSILSHKCSKCMYRDYCKEKKNRDLQFEISNGSQVIQDSYRTQIVNLPTGISADEAVENLYKIMILMESGSEGRRDGNE